MSRGVHTVLAALLVANGCAGGGGEGPAGGGPPAAIAQQTMVVQMDHDGDGELDLLTLDTSRTPYRIVEAIYAGAAGTDPVDVTAALRGLELDIDLSNGLANYYAGSFGVGARTELDVTDSGGNAVRIVVFE